MVYISLVLLCKSYQCYFLHRGVSVKCGHLFCQEEGKSQSLDIWCIYYSLVLGDTKLWKYCFENSKVNQIRYCVYSMSSGPVQNYDTWFKHFPVTTAILFNIDFNNLDLRNVLFIFINRCGSQTVWSTRITPDILTTVYLCRISFFLCKMNI